LRCQLASGKLSGLRASFYKKSTLTSKQWVCVTNPDKKTFDPFRDSFGLSLDSRTTCVKTIIIAIPLARRLLKPDESGNHFHFSGRKSQMNDETLPWPWDDTWFDIGGEG
jgi:hypothetical protein